MTKKIKGSKTAHHHPPFRGNKLKIAVKTYKNFPSIAEIGIYNERRQAR
jgi:hypothetical protein